MEEGSEVMKVRQQQTKATEMTMIMSGVQEVRVELPARPVRKFLGEPLFQVSPSLPILEQKHYNISRGEIWCDDSD